MKQKTRTVRPNALEVRLGNVLEWSIQSWVSTTGRKVRIAEAPWLEGPIGNNYIGAEFYDGYAREVGLDAVTDDDDAGLLPNFYALASCRTSTRWRESGSILLWSIPRFETSTSGRLATTSSRR
jgi:hypothetical protein